jgi:hypothetical protein
MQFINCTPHALTVEGIGTIEPSGTVPRCATVRSDPTLVDGVRYVGQEMGAVTGLPSYTDGIMLVVSGMVLAALNRTRADVVAPDTGPDAIRKDGQIVSVRGFVC